jgi:hypothetical protein
MRAVAMMVFTAADGRSGKCTGTLLNNSRQDRTPYFLGASHCISTQAIASTLQTWWNYRSASCNSSQRDGSFQIVNGGAQLLYANRDTDTSFMRLNGAPPANATFAGWDASAPASLGASVFTIHHPASDWQKYSAGAISHFATCSFINPVTNFVSCIDATVGNSSFYMVAWSRGVAENGSSGAALFSSRGLVMGQLFSGTASCANPGGTESFGRFDLAFDAALSRWLSPECGNPGDNQSGNRS